MDSSAGDCRALADRRLPARFHRSCPALFRHRMRARFRCRPYMRVTISPLRLESTRRTDDGPPSPPGEAPTCKAYRHTRNWPIHAFLPSVTAAQTSVGCEQLRTKREPEQRCCPGLGESKLRLDAAVNWLGGAKRPESPAGRHRTDLQPQRYARAGRGPAERGVAPAAVWRIPTPAPGCAGRDRGYPAGGSDRAPTARRSAAAESPGAEPADAAPSPRGGRVQPKRDAAAATCAAYRVRPPLLHALRESHSAPESAGPRCAACADARSTAPAAAE